MDFINLLYLRNLKTCNLTSRDDPDIMQQSASFITAKCYIIRVYTVCKAKKKRTTDKRIQYFFENYNLTPLDMYNGLSQVYCIKPEELISIPRVEIDFRYV